MCAGLYIKSALFSLKNKEVKIIAKKDLFINDEIRVREVRLVGLDGEQLGIKPLSEAQAIADDANVDLFSSNHKLRHLLRRLWTMVSSNLSIKETKEQRKKQSVVTVKEVRLSPKLLIKVTLKLNFVTAVSSLKKETRLKVSIRFKGRMITHKEIGALRSWRNLLKNVRYCDY